MKNAILILMIILTSLKIFSQPNKLFEKKMNDSLWNSIVAFENILKLNLENREVKEKDINNLVNYFSKNCRDSVQSSRFFVPIKVDKKIFLYNIKRQLTDVIGEKSCVVKFIAWDGWDGVSNYVMARIDIKHHSYDDQVLVILDTKGKITCLSSDNSEGMIDLNYDLKSDNGGKFVSPHQ